ncbi:unnamed protein product [Ascophyllum nodosum]
MAKVCSRKCRTEGCSKQPSFGVAGTQTVMYCAQHASDGMANVCSRKCRTEGCGEKSSFGVAGAETGGYCARHAPDGMVNVCSRKCSTEGCGKKTSFGVAGKKTGEYFVQHATDGVVNVKSRKYRTEVCGKKLSFGVAGTKTAGYCAQHVRPQCGVEGEVGRHHSGKEAIGNVIPGGAEQTTVHSPLTKTSQSSGVRKPSGVSRDSRTRVRPQEITSTASKRAVARESTAGAMTVPDIDGQKSPVKRNSSVKIEVHLSF